MGGCAATADPASFFFGAFAAIAWGRDIQRLTSALRLRWLRVLGMADCLVCEGTIGIVGALRMPGGA